MDQRKASGIPPTRDRTKKGLEIEDDILRAQAEEAFDEGPNIREMDAGLFTAIRYMHTGTSENTQDD